MGFAAWRGLERLRCGGAGASEDLTKILRRKALQAFLYVHCAAFQMQCRSLTKSIAALPFRLERYWVGAATRLPAARSVKFAGEVFSTCTSTDPGRPCWMGMRDPELLTSNSTRTRPSRTSLPTLETVAEMVPYCAQGKPCRRMRAGWPGRIRPSAADGRKSAITLIAPDGT